MTGGALRDSLVSSQRASWGRDRIRTGRTVLGTKSARGARWFGSLAAVAVALVGTPVVAHSGERPPVCEQLRGDISSIAPIGPGQAEITGWMLPGWAESPNCTVKAQLVAYTGWSDPDGGWYKDAFKGRASARPDPAAGGAFTSRMTIEWGNYAVCVEDTRFNPLACWQVLVPGQLDENGVYQPTTPVVRGAVPVWQGAKHPGTNDGGPLPECGHCI